MPVRLVLRSEFIQGHRADTNDHRVSLRAGMTYTTMRRYLTGKVSPYEVNLKALGGLLIYGLGLTKDQAANLRLGDLFEIVDCD